MCRVHSFRPTDRHLTRVQSLAKAPDMTIAVIADANGILPHEVEGGATCSKQLSTNRPPGCVVPPELRENQARIYRTTQSQDLPDDNPRADRLSAGCQPAPGVPLVHHEPDDLGDGHLNVAGTTQLAFCAPALVSRTAGRPGGSTQVGVPLVVRLEPHRTLRFLTACSWSTENLKTFGRILVTAVPLAGMPPRRSHRRPGRAAHRR